MRALIAAILVTAATIAALLVATADAATPPLSFLAPSPALTFAPVAGQPYEAAKLQLLLQNTAATGGRLDIRFFAADGSELTATTKLKAGAKGTKLPLLVLVKPAAA